MGNQGDEGAARAAAFEEVFRHLFVRSHLLAQRMLGSSAEAEDVAAEACARALARWEVVGPLPHRDAWVLRTAANLSIDLLRKRRTSPGQILASLTSGDEPTIERLALQGALTTLPRRQRDVLVLRYLADLDEREVAAALGVSAGTVKKAAHRGIAALRSRLEHDARMEAHLGLA